MKKNTLITLLTLLTAVSCIFVVRKIQSHHVDLLSANIEALTDDEAVAIKTCYMENNNVTNTATWFLKCDDRTTSEMIYKCPDRESFGFKGVNFVCVK